MELEKHVNLDQPIDEAHPVLQFQYLYPYNFSTIAAAFVQKYNYEPRTHLTTTTQVQQLDEDRVMFYRRSDQIFNNNFSYERVIIDRRNGGKITSELIRPRPGSERLFERGVIEAQEGNTIHNHFVFDHQGIKTWKVEFFKLGVEKVLKAIKFSQFEQQE
jgi:hypothetical protein